MTSVSQRILSLVRSLESEAWLDLVAAAPHDVESALRLKSLQTRNATFLACPGLPAVPFNRVFAVDPDIVLRPSEFEAALSWMALQADGGWVVQADPDLPQKATELLNGLSINATEVGWVKHVRHRGAIPCSGDGEPLVRGVESDEARSFAQTVIDGFGFPEVVLPWFEALCTRDRWHCYVATVNGTIAAASARFQGTEGEWFGIDTVLERFRGRGLQRAMIMARLRDGDRAGAQITVAETSRSANAEPSGYSFLNYRNSGFDTAYVSVNYRRT